MFCRTHTSTCNCKLKKTLILSHTFNVGHPIRSLQLYNILFSKLFAGEVQSQREEVRTVIQSVRMPHVWPQQEAQAHDTPQEREQQGKPRNWPEMGISSWELIPSQQLDRSTTNTLYHQPEGTLFDYHHSHSHTCSEQARLATTHPFWLQLHSKRRTPAPNTHWSKGIKVS